MVDKSGDFYNVLYESFDNLEKKLNFKFKKLIDKIDLVNQNGVTNYSKIETLEKKIINLDASISYGDPRKASTSTVQDKMLQTHSESDQNPTKKSGRTSPGLRSSMQGITMIPSNEFRKRHLPDEYGDITKTYKNSKSKNSYYSQFYSDTNNKDSKKYCLVSVKEIPLRDSYTLNHNSIKKPPTYLSEEVIKSGNIQMETFRDDENTNANSHRC